MRNCNNFGDDNENFGQTEYTINNWTMLKGMLSFLMLFFFLNVDAQRCYTLHTVKIMILLLPHFTLMWLAHFVEKQSDWLIDAVTLCQYRAGACKDSFWYVRKQMQILHFIPNICVISVCQECTSYVILVWVSRKLVGTNTASFDIRIFILLHMWDSSGFFFLFPDLNLE